MTSIEVCPRCGGEVRVHEHADELKRVVLSGICYHCGRLVAFTPVHAVPEQETPSPSGEVKGWILRFHDEDRGWLTKKYNVDEEDLLQKHVAELERHLASYDFWAVRA